MCGQRIGVGHSVLPLGQCQRDHDELTIHAPASGGHANTVAMTIMHPSYPAVAVAASALLGGCVSTVADVVKAPFQIAGKAVDLATTSQSEAR